MADDGELIWLAILCWQRDLVISRNLEIVYGDLKVAKLQLLDKLIGWQIIFTGCIQLYHFHPCVVMYVTWKIKISKGISIYNPIGHEKLIDKNNFVQSNLYHVTSNFCLRTISFTRNSYFVVFFRMKWHFIFWCMRFSFLLVEHFPSP